jgi:uncharacterized cupredoxin-like copper-binding protein
MQRTKRNGEHVPERNAYPTGTGKMTGGMGHSMGGMKMVGMEHNDPNSVLIEPGATQGADLDLQQQHWTSVCLQRARSLPVGMVGQFDLK